jgi:hypothetical protein
VKQLPFRIIERRPARRAYIQTGSCLLSDVRTTVDSVFSASLWNCRFKIPRDARVRKNAFFAPTIKSNENRWVTQGAVRSRYVFDIYPQPTSISGISEGNEENWSSLVKITVERHSMTTPLRYQQSYFMAYSSDKEGIHVLTFSKIKLFRTQKIPRLN